jgi:hypothetical protein
MRSALVLLSLLFSVSLHAQDVTGIWRGHFRSNGAKLMRVYGGADDRYKFEVQLDQSKKTFSGVTYSYKTTVFYGKASCQGTVNFATRKVLLEELKILEVRMAGGDACVMTLFLQYSKHGDEEFLEGTYTSMNTRDSSNCGQGTVFLRKVPTSDFYKEPFLVEREKKAERKITKPPVVTPRPKTDSAVVKKNTVPQNPVATKKPTGVTQKPVTKKTPPLVAKKTENVNKVPEDTVKAAITRATVTPATIPKVLATRKNELVQTIVTPARTVTVNIYDNGTIDNDTVSVFIDKKLVLSKQRLTAKPLTVSFTLDEDNEEHELVMVADNLGEIPPNTSLMVVKAGTEQYEVRITSTEQKNAVVMFRFQKE